MSDKKLLEEQVVRRFMKLANIEDLSEGFVKHNSKVLKENMEMAPEGEPAPMDEADELVDEPSMEGNEELFVKVVEAVRDAMNVDATIEGGESDVSDDSEEKMDDLEMDDEEGGEGPEDSMDDSGEEDEDSMKDEELDEGEDEEDEGEEEEDEDEEDEDEEEEDESKMEEQIAEAVLTRVKARLLAEAKAAKMKNQTGSKMKQKIQAKKAGKKMEEASKGGKSHNTGKASSVNWGLKGKSGVGNVAKSSAKKGNLTPAKKSSKHVK